MPNAAETIENLARKLERARVLNDLQGCKTLEEFQEIVKKYEILCNDDRQVAIPFSYQKDGIQKSCKRSQDKSLQVFYIVGETIQNNFL